MPGGSEDPEDRPLDLPPRRALRVGGHRPREHGPAPSTRGPAALRPSTSARSLGPDLLL